MNVQYQRITRPDASTPSFTSAGTVPGSALRLSDAVRSAGSVPGRTLRRGDAVTLADGAEGTLTELWIEEGSLRMAVTVWRDGARVERVVADPREVTRR